MFPSRVDIAVCCNVPQDARSPVLQLDEKLAGLMGCQQLVREALPAAVGKLLQPVQPIKVQHTIE